MRILLLTQSFNSLTQRLHVELRGQGHQLAVELDINDETTLDAVRLFQPDLVIAPFLKRLIPEAVWRNHTCLIVHPGIPGDRGISALDWAILNDENYWGVTVLQATSEYDAGPIWAWRTFPMRAASKTSLYRFEVTEAATEAVLEAVSRFADGEFRPFNVSELPRASRGHWRNRVYQRDRQIDWQRDNTATVLHKIRSGDGHPGTLDEIAGEPCRLYDAHGESSLAGRPGELIAQRNRAVCRATTDGAVWIGQVRLEERDNFKLPTTQALGGNVNKLPNIGLPFFINPRHSTWQDIRYRERGEVGFLYFDFYNGAMSTYQCKRLLTAFDYARNRPTKVIVLAGGRDFWSNGLDLNLIEAAPSPADESWRNINAMDDLCEALITTTSHLTVAAMQGNAGAGGCFLALAADLVMARRGVVLNPHYKNMGNLYGSEYWTYLLPLRAGRDKAFEIMANRLPIGTEQALNCGLIDLTGSSDPVDFDEDVAREASILTRSHNFERLIRDKCRRREADEKVKPLAAYRREELYHMRLNFYGFDPAYHVARYRFVHHTPHAWTPLYLAPHRRLGWQVPDEDGTRAIA